jgi:hypothetical protein
MQRNPSFEGQISLGGHSLGSLILFDLLSHQPVSTKTKDSDVNEKVSEVMDSLIILAQLLTSCSIF